MEFMRAAVVIASWSLFVPALFGQKLPFDVNALLSISRIGEPVLSPDGRMVAFTVQTVDVEKNTKPQQIYTVALEGGFPRQITQDGTNNERPQWSPDSRQIFYTSNRDGSKQVWVMDADGSHSRQVTHLSTEATGQIVSPDGKKLVFVSEVYPECSSDDACNKRMLDEEAKSKLKARIYTTLLYRHWNEWRGKRRQHIFSADVDGTEVKDLTPGTHEAPPFSLDGGEDYAISPDSTEVAFTMNVDADQALSTNSDIYTVPIGEGTRRKSRSGLGADDQPAYSPDGRLLAFRSQQRAGYESDRWRLMVLDRATGRTLNLTEGSRPLGGKLHLGSRFDAAVLHRGGSRTARDCK